MKNKYYIALVTIGWLACLVLASYFDTLVMLGR